MNNIHNNTTDKITLFRADYKGNKTRPEEFWKSGLWSKQINNGDPDATTKYGWIKNIKSHIKPSNELEKFLYNTTIFLSFTSCKEKVQEYLAGKNKRDYNQTDSIKEADGYIFRIEISKSNLVNLGHGVYLHKYKCELNKYIQLSQQFEVPEICAVNFTSCQYCNGNADFFHFILILDCVEYLKNISIKNTDIEESLKSAINDKEWLIMSVDPFKNGGTSSSIPPADFWDFKLYKYE